MEDYKARMKQEFKELKNRIEKLRHILIKNEVGTLGFELSCPIGVLDDPLYYMNEYLKILEIRAEIEKIDLRA